MSNIIGPLYEGEIRTIAGDFSYDLGLIGEDAQPLTNQVLKIKYKGSEVTDDMIKIIAGPEVDGEMIKADIEAVKAQARMYDVIWEADSGSQHLVVPGKLKVKAKG